MRTRSRTIVTKTFKSNPTTASVMRFPCGGDSQIINTNLYAGVAEMPTRYTEEWISDSLGRKTPHPVVHRSKDVVIDEILVPLLVPNADPPGGYVQWTGYEPAWVPSRAYWMSNGLSWDYNVSAPSLPYRWSIDMPSSFQESSMKEDVIAKAKQLKADVLLDLVEANQMWPSIRSLATCLPKLARNWSSVSRIVKTASGSFLAWKFGVSPVLQDVMAINRHLGRLREDLRKHSDGEVMTVTRLAKLPCRFDDTKDVRNRYFGYDADEVVWRGDIFHEPMLRYVLSVKPKIQYKTELFQKLDYALSRFATSPASLAWELVPFSFVFDWFVDIRGALRAVDNSLGFAPYDVVNFSRSLSYNLRTEVDHTYLQTCTGGVLNKVYCGAIMYKHYERFPVSMDTNVFNWKPRFGKNQAGISAALIGQQLTKAVREARI